MRRPACWWAAAIVLLFSHRALVAASASRADAGTPASIRWVSNSVSRARIIVEVAGLEAGTLRRISQANWTAREWQQLLPVYAEQGDLIADIGLPPMLGQYSVGEATIQFEPAFPLEPGLTYRAVFHPARLPGATPRGARMISSAFRLPVRSTKPTTVVRHVYPSAPVLPENLLKFYVHFSAPMSRGHIYQHIHLRDATGRDVELPFLEIDEELWDSTMTRLTLFIDPGRIKREVKPLEEIGPALEQGRRFTLRIAPEWKDAAGNPLREAFEKHFTVGPPDREPPDPARWKLDMPARASREPLMVKFPEPLDHALAERMIRVTDANGSLLTGEVTLEDDERRWMFRPAQPWRVGPARLVVQTTIEDLAGNNIGKPFEVDLVEPVQRRLTNATVAVPFEIR